MNLLQLLCFYRLSHSGTGKVHGPSVVMIGDVEQLGRSKWNVNGNGSIPDPFKCNFLGDVSSLYVVFFRQEVCKCGRMFLITPNCE